MNRYKSTRSNRLKSFFKTALVLLIVPLFFIFSQNVFSQKISFIKKFVSIPQRKFKRVCNQAPAKQVRCHTHVVTDEQGTPQAFASLPAGGYGPVQFHTAYNLPCTPGGPVQSLCATPLSFGSQIIAIVDAYNDPTVENDLDVYSSAFGLPPCTKANGCLTVVNQYGSTSPLPATNSSWALEISLDTQIAHAICQTCKILLVEAKSNNFQDLLTAENTAVNMDATVISNSFGGSEWSGETGYDSYFNHPGVVITASTGDNGFGMEFPAASRYVVAVGGTTLGLFTDNTYASESVWRGSGSGCSLYESADPWQSALPNWPQTGCGQWRATADISADADPDTGAAIYDSTSYNGFSGWWIMGGTSLSAPLVAASFALAGGIPKNSYANQILYTNTGNNYFNDVTVGTNGTCTSIICKASAGYDGPSGLGTPNGIAGFIQNPNSPSPTSFVSPTPINSPSPTIKPSPTITPTPVGKDTIPPIVSITSPLNGSTVARRTNISVSATASDNVGVARVTFYRNNFFIICIRTSAPYSCSYNTGSQPQNLSIKAVATDKAGNTSSDSVTVKVQ